VDVVLDPARNLFAEIPVGLELHAQSGAHQPVCLAVDFHHAAKPMGGLACGEKADRRNGRPGHVVPQARHGELEIDHPVRRGDIFAHLGI